MEVLELNMADKSQTISISSNDGVSSNMEEDLDIAQWRQRFNGKVMEFMSERREKWIFIWSVINFGITCYGMAGGWFAGAIAWYYSIKFPVMILIRYRLYKSKSWQWFLLDFCYWVNIT